jgi:hypothetical protein
MLQLLRRPSPLIMTVEELRRGIEDLGEDDNRLSYHDCWIASIANILIPIGVISVVGLGQKMRIAQNGYFEQLCTLLYFSNRSKQRKIRILQTLKNQTLILARFPRTAHKS